MSALLSDNVQTCVLKIYSRLIYNVQCTLKWMLCLHTNSKINDHYLWGWDTYRKVQVWCGLSASKQMSPILFSSEFLFTSVSVYIYYASKVNNIRIIMYSTYNKCIQSRSCSSICFIKMDLFGEMFTFETTVGHQILHVQFMCCFFWSQF